MKDSVIKDSTKLMRHHLGSVDLSDVVDEKAMTEQERKDYCGAISAVFPRLEKDIKKFLYEQLLFIGTTSENWEQVSFGRGGFDGAVQLLDRWRAAHAEHQSQGNEETFDKSNPIGEI